MKEPRYQDFLNDLASGSYYGVFVDDTGSPGLQSTPPNLHPERKSFVGVVVPPRQMPEVLSQFPEVIDELRRLTGAKEFHFTDIYNGKDDFQGIDLQVRLNIFRFMADIFSRYKFPIFVQTLDPCSLSDIHSRELFPNQIGPFDLNKHEDMALLFLLRRIKQYIEKDKYGYTARVFIDEGYKRKGTAISIPAWKSVFADGLICFARSSSILQLQLADFAAFAMNRTQLIIGRERRSSLDKTLLEILSPVACNYQNIEKRKFQF